MYPNVRWNRMVAGATVVSAQRGARGFAPMISKARVPSLLVILLVVTLLVPAGSATAMAPEQQDPLILSYAAKFVCQEALQPGQYWYGAAAPIVNQKTDVLIHNPNAFPVTLYKKAVRAPLENFNVVEQGVDPGKFKEVRLKADAAFRIDCDDIAKLLTGDPAATALTTFTLGVVVEGFVVIAIGPQPVPVPGAPAVIRFPQLDVTADYVRSSEVMKKDIHYQPWWWWWWWPLPWRLGYAYERLVPIDPTHNIDCRGLLYDALAQDAQQLISDGVQREQTLNALKAGRAMEPTQQPSLSGESPSALVALIGRCNKIGTNLADIDYVLVSNKGPTDPDPRGMDAAQASVVRYPWIPGRWYDLPVVMPQNVSTDIDDFFRKWQQQRWVDAGETAANAQAALVYWFPYWCGWGYWWWWNNSDCIDIGVGEGESLDVEQITPVRVFYPQWPPALE